jgi:hypothetical protein
MEQCNIHERQITGKHWRKYILYKNVNKQTNNEVIIIIIAVIGYYKND